MVDNYELLRQDIRKTLDAVGINTVCANIDVVHDNYDMNEKISNEYYDEEERYHDCSIWGEVKEGREVRGYARFIGTYIDENDIGYFTLHHVVVRDDITSNEIMKMIDCIDFKDGYAIDTEIKERMAQ